MRPSRIIVLALACLGLVACYHVKYSVEAEDETLAADLDVEGNPFDHNDTRKIRPFAGLKECVAAIREENLRGEIQCNAQLLCRTLQAQNAFSISGYQALIQNYQTAPGISAHSQTGVPIMGYGYGLGLGGGFLCWSKSQLQANNGWTSATTQKPPLDKTVDAGISNNVSVPDGGAN